MIPAYKIADTLVYLGIIDPDEDPWEQMSKIRSMTIDNHGLRVECYVEQDGNKVMSLLGDAVITEVGDEVDWDMREPEDENQEKPEPVTIDTEFRPPL